MYLNFLMVDDDKYICETTQLILSQSGYILDTCYTGEDALKHWNKKKYDMAFIDIRLPDINGIELLTKFHKINPIAKKIIISGYITPQNKEESIKKGAYKVIEKPFDPGYLLNTIKKCIELEKKVKIRN